jgi:hypothetical protein
MEIRPDPALACYLAEWYTFGQPITDIGRLLRGAMANMDGEPSPPRLLYAVEVSSDAYAFGVFAAESAELVARVCLQAGLPVDRITAAARVPLTDAIAE